MAAVAVAGAASAQVSITGNLGYGWETSSTGNGPSTKGLKVTDGNVKFSATEDLGGGMSVATAMDIQSRGRDTTIAGRDASITLVTAAGGFTLGAVEAGNGIIGLGGAGAPTIGLDGNTVLAGGTDVDLARYDLAFGNGVAVFASRTDGATAALNGVGEGVNPANTFGASYAANGLSAKFDTTKGLLAKRNRMSASYDLSSAVVGIGYETRKAVSGVGGTDKDTVIGVSVPMGAVNFGLNYGKRKNSTANTSNKGVDLGVSYALSKRTALYAQMQRVTVGTAEATTTTRFKLKTSF